MSTAYATLEDVQSVLLSHDLTAQQIQLVDGLLDRAATRINTYCRRTFTQITEDVKFRAVGSQVRLPKGPVESVNSVKFLDYFGNEYNVPVFGFDGIDTINLVAYTAVLNLPEALAFGETWTGTVVVNYTHGYPEVPQDIINLNADLVARIFNSPSQGMTGITGQAVGPFNVRLDATGAAGGMVVLTDEDKDLLKPYRRVQKAVELR